MVTVVIIMISIWVAWSIYKDFKKRKAARQIENRHKRIEIRGERLERHRRIWSVLFFINSFNTLEERMKAGQPTKKMIKDFEDAKAALFEYKPNKDEIKTAIRFCKIEYVRGKCSHQLTTSDIQSIIDIYTFAKIPTKIAE